MSKQRIFIGIYPTGILYADRQREVQGDYARLAFLPWSLVPEFARDCPPELRPEIEAHMATVQARRGEDFEVSGCGQTVLLGGATKSPAS